MTFCTSWKTANTYFKQIRRFLINTTAANKTEMKVLAD